MYRKHKNSNEIFAKLLGFSGLIPFIIGFIMLNFNINKSKNDFRPFLDQVIIEIKRNETSFMKSIDEIQTLKIIELAERSSLEHRRIDLD